MDTQYVKNSCRVFSIQNELNGVNKTTSLSSSSFFFFNNIQLQSCNLKCLQLSEINLHVLNNMEISAYAFLISSSEDDLAIILQTHEFQINKGLCTSEE